VRVHYGEGVAIHIGPEPCVGAPDIKNFETSRATA
jgi:hypothetical protein